MYNQRVTIYFTKNRSGTAMKYVILGTAGHVDHGKTSLVRALTGVNTDRLKEETARGITIELGFAPFDLPGGQRVGIVDVPGHEKFIKNMLAGATGVDFVLFVIAADEGVMPQTREHMDILRLLGVSRGIVVLTKIDMVDEEWMELVRDDISEYIKDSPLKDAPICEVSSVTGAGMPELLERISELCLEVAERPSAGICRLAVDRVFVMTGFGTVVTGTLWGGSIKSGDTLELHPIGKKARVRSLQVHGETCETAYAGQRVAVCLAGIEKATVERGSWLAAPGALQKNNRLDIMLELLPDAPELKHHARVHVHHGTDEVLARIKLFDRDTLESGQSCFAQLELETALTALPGDRLVLRFYSPVFTIGGGVILDAAATRHKRKMAESRISRLEALYSGDPQKMILTSIDKGEIPWRMRQIADSMQISVSDAAEHVAAMIEHGSLLLIGDDYYLTATCAESHIKKLTSWLEGYFKSYPMRFGAPKKEAAQANFTKMDQKQYTSFFKYIDSLDKFFQDETTIRLKDWKPILKAEQTAIIEKIREMYSRSMFSPPLWSEAVAELSISAKEQGEFLQWFLRSGELVSIYENVLYRQDALDEAEAVLRKNSVDGGFTLGEARDALGTTRKFAQQIGEYFDLIKKTYWDGQRHYWS
jgi:selenocysteine-specific elongation factor